MPRASQLLAIVRSDTTFSLDTLPARGVVPPRPAWRGRCFYCDTPIWLETDGRPITDVSVEHLLPRARGGTDDLGNLVLACSRCNQEKGRRLDTRKDADAVARIAALVAKRASRWREPG